MFVATADAGSVTKAAQRLNMSQSVLSRQITALEQDLGTILFHRHARGLVLTHQGEILFRTAQGIVAQLDHVQNQLAEQYEKPTGELKITTNVAFGTHWLASRLRGFLDNNPDVTIRMLLSDQALDLGMREADVAIRFGAPTAADLIQRKLFTAHFHVYASADYLKRYGKPKSEFNLAGHHMIGFAGEQYYFTPSVNYLLRLDASHNVPAPRILINSIKGVRDAVIDGAGIAVLPTYLADSVPQLVPILPNIQPPSIDAFFVYPEEQKNLARIKAFRDYMVHQTHGWSY